MIAELYVCPVCGQPGRACGDDHVRGPVITSRTIKGDSAVPEPQELKEYEYVVGHLPVTAMLTEKMAKRLDAKPVGSTESPGEGNVVNNEAQRASTHTREVEDAGVKTTHPDGESESDVAGKARTARNKRSS